MSPRSRLSFLLFTLFLVALLAAGFNLAARAASQNFPPWKFKPLSSILPLDIDMNTSFLNDLGEQGELVITYYPQGVGPAHYGVVFGGVLTPMFTAGDPAPGGGAFSNMSHAYAASPTLVYFSALVHDGGQDVLRYFRWNSGSIIHLPTQANESYDVNKHDSHGKFIFKRTLDAENTEYRITDGVTFSDPITLLNDDINDNSNTSQQLLGITADGAFLIGESIVSGFLTCTLRPTAPDQPNVATTTSRLFWLGSRSGNVVTGSATDGPGCQGSGTNVDYGVMNSAGDILSQEYTYAYNYNDPDFEGTGLTTLRLYPGNGAGPSVVAQGEHVNDVGPYFFLQPLAITEAHQPIFSAAASLSAPYRLYDGPNPTTDPFDGDFFAGFGQDGTLIGIYHFSEKGILVGQAQLADNTYVDVIGRAASASQWIDPAGGSWGDAGNWDSNEVPGSTSETLFNLDAAYTVNVGTHDVGRVRIENGFVTFDNANLALLGPLTVGNDATFDLTSGKLKTDYLVVGELPPADILNPPTAHVQVSNHGTVLSATAVISISHASPGSLFLDDAQIDSGSLVIGENFPGSAALSGQHASWFTNGAMAVGYNYTGTLSIESGAFMRSAGQVVIGQGNSLQEYTSQVQVRNFNAPLPGFGANWLLLDTLTIGNFLRGELDISHGGTVVLFSDDGVLQAGLRAHPAPGFDAFISVDGSSDTETVNAALQVLHDVLLGMADGASVGVNVNRGGLFSVFYADLFLGFLPGSEAVMTVAGINDHGVPARLVVERPENQFDSGICAIGESGTGMLLIHSGGQVDCGTIRIGGQTGGIGFVQVNGANGGSSLTTEGGLCIGGDFLGLCGAAESGSQGTLELKNSASVSAGRGTLVGPGGKIIGSGDLFVGVLGLDVAEGGVVDPGVTVLAPENISPLAAATIETGTFTITGNVTISPTAEVKLDILGLADHDQLIINGNLNLAGGTLTLAFGNGYLPQEGATFELLTAASTAGEFDDVEITGLPAGYAFSVALVNGKLVAEVTEAPAATFQIFLPLVVRD
jgi:T5SS/PEP-CTERM-associated repeat protein